MAWGCDVDPILFPDRKRPADAGFSDTPLFMAPTTPPSNGTATSDEAAHSLSEETLNEQHRAILNALWRHRDHGLTDEELQDATGINPSSERPRRGELVEGGLVVVTALTRRTKSGRNANVWRLTERAVRMADARRRATAGYVGREDAA